jgi:hypothetical protein
MIKTMLTIIDGGQAAQVTITAPVGQPELEPIPGEESPFTHTGDDINRFKQIVDLASEPKQSGIFANAPDTKYSDIDSVTVDAGGGMNGPKHPHDLRVKDPSAYPHTQDQSHSLEPHSEKSDLHAALINAMRGI